MAPDVLQLDTKDMVAQGHERMVFVHPEDPTRLIKICKTRTAADFPRWTFSHLTQRYIPATRLRSVIKQYDEYMRLMLKTEYEINQTLPICHLYGFLKTNLGMGVLTERVMSPTGTNAPTLVDMHANGELDLTSLNAFVEDLYDRAICVSDLNPDNFVFGERYIGPAGRSKGPEWVLIDGFGDRFAIQVRGLTARTRRMSLDDAFKRSRKLPGLRWDAKLRRFAISD